MPVAAAIVTSYHFDQSPSAFRTTDTSGDMRRWIDKVGIRSGAVVRDGDNLISSSS